MKSVFVLSCCLVLIQAQVHVQLPYSNPAGVTYVGAGYHTPYASAAALSPQGPIQPLAAQHEVVHQEQQHFAPAPAPVQQQELVHEQPQYYNAAPAPAVQYHRQVIAQLPPLQPFKFAAHAPAPLAVHHQKVGYAHQQVLTSLPGVADVPITKTAYTQGFTQKEVDVAHPAVTTRKVKVRRPAVRKEFYDIEHRIIVRPAGSATLELSQPTSKVQQGPSVLTPTQYHQTAPVVRYGLGRQIVDGQSFSSFVPAAGPAEVRSAQPAAQPAPAPELAPQPQPQQAQYQQQAQSQQPQQAQYQQQAQSQQPQQAQYQQPQQAQSQQPQQAQYQQQAQSQQPQQAQPQQQFAQFQPQAQFRQAIDQDTEVIDAARDDLGQQQQQPQQPQPQPQQPFPQPPPQQQQQQQQPQPQPQLEQGGITFTPGMPAELQARLIQLLTAKGGTVTELLNEDGKPADSASVLQIADSLGGDINLQGSERITTRRIVVSRPIETIQEIDIQEPATKLHRHTYQQPTLFKTHIPGVARVPVDIPHVKNIATPVVKTTYAQPAYAQPAYAHYAGQPAQYASY